MAKFGHAQFTFNVHLAYSLDSVLNVKDLVGAFNQERRRPEWRHYLSLWTCNFKFHECSFPALPGTAETSWAAAVARRVARVAASMADPGTLAARGHWGAVTCGNVTRLRLAITTSTREMQIIILYIT